MSQKEMAFKIEELANKAERIFSLQNALYAVFYYQEDWSIKDFQGAFILLAELTCGMLDGLEELTKNAFDNLRKDEKDNDKKSIAK